MRPPTTLPRPLRPSTTSPESPGPPPRVFRRGSAAAAAAKSASESKSGSESKSAKTSPTSPRPPASPPPSSPQKKVRTSSSSRYAGLIKRLFLSCRTPPLPGGGGVRPLHRGLRGLRRPLRQVQVQVQVHCQLACKTTKKVRTSSTSSTAGLDERRVS